MMPLRIRRKTCQLEKVENSIALHSDEINLTKQI